jgi:D-alanyl-D-alanine carboxypeptidase
MGRIATCLGALCAAGALVVAIAACGGNGHAARHVRPPAASPGLTPRIARTLEQRLRSEVADSGIPGGASATIVFPDGKEWTGVAGTALLRSHTPWTSRTSITFDSVTKIATAALALRLVEQGRLRLEDPIRRWYAAWRGDARATIRDLLGHTSGLGDPNDRFFAGMVRHPRRPVTAAEALAATARPGPRTREAVYSNSGFVLLGTILRRAAGVPVATAMRRDVLAVPGGQGLALQPGERPHQPFAHAYYYPHGGGTPTDASVPGSYIPSLAWAGGASTAGALAGDVPSLARWAHALLGGHILRRSSLREMTRFRPGAFWAGYGLGLALSSIDRRPMWGHGGDGLGTHTELWHLPKENLTIAVSWNDDQLESDAPFVPSLLRTALGVQ